MRDIRKTGALIAHAPLLPIPAAVREEETMNNDELAAHVAAETSVATHHAPPPCPQPFGGGIAETGTPKGDLPIMS